MYINYEVEKTRFVRVQQYNYDSVRVHRAYNIIYYVYGSKHIIPRYRVYIYVYFNYHGFKIISEKRIFAVRFV